MTIFDIVNYQFRRPSFLPLVDGGNSTCYVRTYVERRSYRCQREQYFSAKPGEGVGDRARERKRVKSARCRGASGRETERMRESHQGENGKRREERFTAAGKRRSAGTHVESAKRSRSCVKCLDITVLFRPARSSPVLSRFCNSVLFTLVYRANRPADRRAQPFLSSRSRARSCRFDDPPATIWRWFNCLRPTEMKHLQVELFHRAGLLFSIGRPRFRRFRMTVLLI